MAIVIKNVEIDPPRVGNDGGGRVTLRCVVLTTGEGARVEDVTLWSGSLPGLVSPVRLPLDETERLGRTAEGVYGWTIAVPRLADPGPHELILAARDSAGDSAELRAPLTVFYARPAYAGGFSAPASRAAIVEAGDAPLVDGNAVRPLPDGAEALARRLDLIRSARRQVNLQTYTLDDEGQSRAVVEALLERAEAGVEVNVLLNSATQMAVSPGSALRLKYLGLLRGMQLVGRRREPLGDEPTGSASLVEALRELLDGVSREMSRERPHINLLLFDPGRLRRARRLNASTPSTAVWLRRYLRRLTEGFLPQRPESLRQWLPIFEGPGGLPAWPLLDYAIHEKALVVDGEVALVGGRNLDDRYFRTWLDLDIELTGPIVEHVQRAFLDSFRAFAPDDDPHRPMPTALLPTPRRAGRARAQFVRSRPWDGAYDAMASLVTHVQIARRRVFASSQYLVLPESLLRDALVDAAARGVDVRLLTNSFESASALAFSTPFLLSLGCFEDLIAAGVRVYTLDGDPGSGVEQPYLHRKEYLFDGEAAAIGSFNLSMRSCYVESESLANVYDPEFVADRERAFLALLERRATEVTPERLAHLLEEHRERMEYARYLELLY